GHWLSKQGARGRSDEIGPGGPGMAPFTHSPHDDSDLPDIQDADCPDCDEELVPEDEEVSLPPLQFTVTERPAAAGEVPSEATHPSAAPAPEKKPAEAPSLWGSLLLSLFIALMLGASFELITHQRLAAQHGNGPVILALLIGALVIHAIRAFAYS